MKLIAVIVQNHARPDGADIGRSLSNVCQMLLRPHSVCYDAGLVPGDELIGNVIQIIADDLRLRADA